MDLLDKIDLHIERLGNFLTLKGYKSDKMIRISREIKDKDLEVGFKLKKAELLDYEKKLTNDLILQYKNK